MHVDRQPLTSIWLDPTDPACVCVIDQRRLPHELLVCKLSSVDEMYAAIKDMLVRGAPLIGVAAAYGVYLSALHGNDSTFKSEIAEACRLLLSARPTAVNLNWALTRQQAAVKDCRSLSQAVAALLKGADAVRENEIAISRSIGSFGSALIKDIAGEKRGQPVQILTHCNAGWLATVELGTATAPVYCAFDDGVPLHVYVDETRPRNQGAALTAWELGRHGVPLTVIADNAGGHLMQNGKVDMVIVGTDRVAANGDVANKIGTYLKALAARANNVPFYVAAPSSSIDFSLRCGSDIPIEERHPDEVKYATGRADDGSIQKVLLTPENAQAANFAFDITPAQLITALITERGICAASYQGLQQLFPEMKTVHSL